MVGQPLKLLVLGGTAWLGRQVAEAALADGHTVCCAARGVSGPVPAGARWHPLDRDADTAPASLAELAAEPWDAVVDLTRQPGQAADAALALRHAARHWVLVSSVSVYANSALAGQDESAACWPALQARQYSNPADYGAAKVACEQQVLHALGAERVLLCRAGLIGGPGDVSDRSGWWPWTLARAASAGHTVLVPEGEGLATQIIDVRDLAQWIVHAAVECVSGAVNAVGESRPLAEVLALAAEVAAAATGQQARLRRMHDAWLLNQGVRPWAGPRSLPLWVPGDGHAGFGRWARTRALQTGLRCRPLADTLADVLDWEQRRPADTLRRVGLSDAVADELLALADSAP